MHIRLNAKFKGSEQVASEYLRTVPWGMSPAGRRLYAVHLDPGLLFALAGIAAFGLVVLFSAAHGDLATLVDQVLRLGLAFLLMLATAQLAPHLIFRWSPAVYAFGLALLLVVLLVGVTAKGAQRWLDVPGLPRFQPSEVMKLAVPLVLAWYFHDRPLPPTWRDLAVAVALVLVPAGLIAAQPDFGTGVMVAASGFAVLLLAGIRWHLVFAAATLSAAAAPLVWLFLHDYQKARVLTFFNPERDPLGAGWNIVQSKTALGSGGFAGKGLLKGTQSQLEFLPESRTDFIVAVIGEELGLVGVTLLLGLYLVVIARALTIAARASATFGRLAAGGLTLVFFAYVFVNIAMVSGLLPVVGVPLPLVSFGGTSAITLLVGFGIVMSIHTHRTGTRRAQGV